MTAIHIIICGRVQGVWYRDWTVREARRLGVDGWVRNQPDGTVEAHVEGEETAVRALIALMHDGPPAARVERIEEREVEPVGLSGFKRR